VTVILNTTNSYTVMTACVQSLSGQKQVKSSMFLNP